jgi:hypothetical protein
MRRCGGHRDNSVRAHSRVCVGTPSRSQIELLLNGVIPEVPSQLSTGGGGCPGTIADIDSMSLRKLFEAPLAPGFRTWRGVRARRKRTGRRSKRRTRTLNHSIVHAHATLKSRNGRLERLHRAAELRESFGQSTPWMHLFTKKVVDRSARGSKRIRAAGKRNSIQ